MTGLRVLITNLTLASRTGTETYVRDLAIGLLRRGHVPMVYSPHLGELARELEAATVSVADNLDAFGEPPDVIHGHHTVETLTALLHFPQTPAVFLCHDWSAWHDAPPALPRVRRYIAVDETCRDRLVNRHGLPPERVRVVLHGVDLNRFRPRSPLPSRPERAIVFSNQAADDTYLGEVRAACATAGITLDVAGLRAGATSNCPEDILGRYDAAFAKARCAQEALAVGCAVVLCDAGGMGPLVTTAEFDRLRQWNFGRRALSRPVRADALIHELARYDAAEAAAVTARMRGEANLEATVDSMVAIYREVIDEQHSQVVDHVADSRAAAACLRRVMPIAHELHAVRLQVTELEAEHDRLKSRLSQVPAPAPTPTRIGRLKSCLCTQSLLESAEFRAWAERLRHPHWLHRKLWEFCYVAQALYERDMLRPGRRGLGFAVGQEPLAALFASMGCEIVATDLHRERAQSLGWVDSRQHAAELDDLNRNRLCDPELFRKSVSFRPVDMNAIPDDLNGFDFCWSACSFEHLGSIQSGLRFVRNMTRCLKPGGVGVHTTEFNVSSNDATHDLDPSFVLFRRRDIEEVADWLRAQGHHIDLDFDPGSGSADSIVDMPPFTQQTHLKLQLAGYTSTSIGLIVEIGDNGPAQFACERASLSEQFHTGVRRLTQKVRRRLARIAGRAA